MGYFTPTSDNNPVDLSLNSLFCAGCHILASDADCITRITLPARSFGGPVGESYGDGTLTRQSRSKETFYFAEPCPTDSDCRALEHLFHHGFIAARPPLPDAVLAQSGTVSALTQFHDDLLEAGAVALTHPDVVEQAHDVEVVPSGATLIARNKGMTLNITDLPVNPPG